MSDKQYNLQYPRDVPQVVVTGLGIVTAAGNNPDEVWSTVRSGRCSGTRPIACFDVSRLATRIAATVVDFDPASLFGRRSANMDRVSQLALHAADQAVADAALPLGEIDPYRIGVCCGTGVGGIETTSYVALTAASSPRKRVMPHSIPMSMHNGTAFRIAQRIGANGPNYTFSTACSSSSLALGEAARMIRRRDVDAVVVCGADAAVVPSVFRAWSSMRAMTTRNDSPATAFTPFDLERDGFVIGEGAAAVVLESGGRAERRGARAYGEILGFGTTCDAGSPTAPVAKHQAEAMRRALDDADVAPRDLGFVIAHGTATRLNDVTEAEAIRNVLGPATEDVPVVAYKPFFGHTMGASGAIELVTGLLALDRGELPATPNLETPDPACRVRHLDSRTVPLPGQIFMCDSFGFGGSNAVLIGRGVGHNNAPEQGPLVKESDDEQQ